MTPIPEPDELAALEFNLARTTTPEKRRAILAGATTELLSKVHAIFDAWGPEFPDGARIAALVEEEEKRRAAIERAKEVGNVLGVDGR